MMNFIRTNVPQELVRRMIMGGRGFVNYVQLRAFLTETIRLPRVDQVVAGKRPNKKQREAAKYIHAHIISLFYTYIIFKKTSEACRRKKAPTRV
jgi:hypothetical protein